VSDDFHARQGFLGFKFDEIVLAKAPPESSQQKRSKKVCDKYDTSWVTSYNFMNVCEYLIKQSTFKVFYYKYWNQIKCKHFIFKSLKDETKKK